MFYKIYESEFLTVNEMRADKGFPPIANDHSIYMNKGMSIECIGPRKNVCLYCSRPNHHENELCESCGAPLLI